MGQAEFYLFANCNFVPDKYDEWQAAYDDLAVYVYKNEPTTMTYYFGIPIDYASDISKTTHMFAFEAYGKREDLYETHFHSPAMATFLSRIPSTMTTGLDLAHYVPVAGFLDKRGDLRECGVMQDTRVWCKDEKSRAAVLEKLEKLSSGITNGRKDGGDGVLTFMVFKSLDDDISVRLLGRWTDRVEMEKFLRRNDILEFWLGSKEEVVKMEWKSYVPNGKGWLHR